MRITLAIMALSIVLSGIYPADTMTWFMEIAPILIGMPFVYYYGKQDAISRALLICISIHAVILAVGGHYTYANVPMGNWFVQWGIFERNNYDKIGHFIQGVTPALLLIEIFNRKQIGQDYPNFMKTITVFVCAGFSALYEIIEWFAAVLLGSGADEFLGTQGYVWDTQSDMLLAILGGICGAFFLARFCFHSQAKTGLLST